MTLRAIRPTYMYMYMYIGQPHTGNGLHIQEWHGIGDSVPGYRDCAH